MKKFTAALLLIGALVLAPAAGAFAELYPDVDDPSGEETTAPAPPAPQQFVAPAEPETDDVQLETEALPVETTAPTEQTPAPTDEELETLAQSDDPANLIWLWFGAGAVALVLALLLVFLLRRKKEQPEEA